MTFEYEVKMMDGYLLVSSSGTLDTVQELKNYVSLLRREALAHGTKRVLIDERNLMDQQDTMEAYEFSETNAITSTALAGIRISCICHPDNYALNKTYETLLLNRSLMFKVFLNEDEAIEWLMS